MNSLLKRDGVRDHVRWEVHRNGRNLYPVTPSNGEICSIPPVMHLQQQSTDLSSLSMLELALIDPCLVSAWFHQRRLKNLKAELWFRSLWWHESFFTAAYFSELWTASLLYFKLKVILF